MTVDHLTAAQKAVSGLISENSGWGFGVAVVTRRDHVSAPVGSYGWAGGLGTSWRSDPSEDMVVILLTQASWTSLVPARVSRDFGILALPGDRRLTFTPSREGTRLADATPTLSEL
jgi:CubicO group peptidase (beta-lactamase class C family)